MENLAGNDGCGPVAVFRAGLQQLFLQMRRPTYRSLVGHADRAGLVLRTSTIGTLLNGPGTPRWGTVEAFVSACARHAQSHRIDVPAGSFNLDEWRARYQGIKDATDARRDKVAGQVLDQRLFWTVILCLWEQFCSHGNGRVYVSAVTSSRRCRATDPAVQRVAVGAWVR
jgi:hypothetical protein